MSEYMEYDWISKSASGDIKNPARMKPEDKESCLNNLKQLLQQIESTRFKHSIDRSDKQLMKFLNARNFNANEAFQLFQKYHSHRDDRAYIFHNLSLESDDIKFCLQNCLPGVIPSKDRKGRCVLLISASNWDCTYSLISIYRSILYCLELLMEDVHNQTNGTVFIVDWTEFPFRHTINIKPSLLKIMIEGLQDCFPTRYKGIHFVNQPWYIETVLTCIKPFLRGDIANKMYFHGNNLSTLHEHVHRDILPTELGGEKPSFNPQIWLSALNPKCLSVL